MRGLGGLLSLVCLLGTGSAFMCQPKRLELHSPLEREVEVGESPDADEREDEHDHVPAAAAASGGPRQWNNHESEDLTLCDIHVFGAEGCPDEPSNLGHCVKVEKENQLYLCRNNEVFLSKCTDSKCTEGCSDPLPNPYSYIPTKCVQGTLTAACTSGSTSHIEWK